MAQNLKNVTMVCMGFHNYVTLPPIQTLTSTVIMAWLASSTEEKYLEALPQMNGNQGTVSPWNVLTKSKLCENSWVLWSGCQSSNHPKISTSTYSCDISMCAKIYGKIDAVFAVKQSIILQILKKKMCATFVNKTPDFPGEFPTYYSVIAINIVWMHTSYLGGFLLYINLLMFWYILHFGFHAQIIRLIKIKIYFHQT